MFIYSRKRPHPCNCVYVYHYQLLFISNSQPTWHFTINNDILMHIVSRSGWLVASGLIVECSIHYAVSSTDIHLANLQHSCSLKHALNIDIYHLFICMMKTIIIFVCVFASWCMLNSREPVYTNLRNNSCLWRVTSINWGTFTSYMNCHGWLWQYENVLKRYEIKWSGNTVNGFGAISSYQHFQSVTKTLEFCLSIYTLQIWTKYLTLITSDWDIVFLTDCLHIYFQGNFFIISFLFIPLFNMFVSIFIQSYGNSSLHVSTLYIG